MNGENIDYQQNPIPDEPDPGGSGQITPDPRIASRSRKYVFALLYTMVLVVFLSAGIMLGLYISYMIDLPEVAALEDYQPSVVTEIFADDNKPIGQLYLERRKLVSPTEIPRYFKEAVISIEDKSFYRHFGLDVQRIIQSLVLDLFHMKIVRGASTITQQLSKLLFLTPEVSWERKIKEAILAIQIEKNYSKERIFAFYANKIYLAHGNYGIASAAEYYFDKPVDTLSLSECALLAAIIKNPGRYSPVLHPDNALNRRNLVLDEMFDDNYITQRQWLDARKEPLRIVGKEMDKDAAAYFVEWVRQYLQRRYSNKQIFSLGLKVYTTLGRHTQESAEQALREGVLAYDKRRGWRGKLVNVLAEGAVDLNAYKHPDWSGKAVPAGIVTGLVMEVQPQFARIRIGDFHGEVGPAQIKWTNRRTLDKVLRVGDLALFRILKANEADKSLELALEQYPLAQGAFLAIDNKTGAVKAMVGGYDWSANKFNRAVQAKRQTGSIFKPFVYTTAINSGMTPEDTVLDEPLTIFSDIGTEYTPQNYEKGFQGRITLRKALAESINIPAVRIAMQVGIPNIIQTARKFGITSNLYPYPSMALGSSEISLWEMVSAFSAFPGDGYRMEPYFIQRIEDYHGNVLEAHKPVVHQVIPRDTSRTMVSLLRGVVEFGTSTKARDLRVDVAGKTGTTNDFTDAWFIGFTPSLTAGVWVGLDEKDTLGNGEAGARTALPIWIEFMKGYLKGRPREYFPADTSPYAAPPDRSEEP